MCAKRSVLCFLTLHHSHLVCHICAAETYNNKSTYEGEFKASNRHGSGRMDYVDGSWYNGQWKEGKRHGKGTYYNKEKNSHYFGMFVDGLMHGKGALYDRNTNGKQTGVWEQGKLVSPISSATAIDEQPEAAMQALLDKSAEDRAAHAAHEQVIQAQLESLTGPGKPYKHGSEPGQTVDDDDDHDPDERSKALQGKSD
jgi:hypothetical protein